MYLNTWIVVANGSLAKFFKASSNDVIEEIETMEHPQAKAKGRDILTDKPGRSFDIQGMGRHHMGNLQDVDEQEMLRFAKDVNNWLYKKSEEDEIKQLYLVSSPKFLGVLNKHLHPNLLKIVEGKVDKDLTSEKPDAIRKHLPLTL